MNVVISGYYGFKNEGDEAILFCIIQALKKINPVIAITVLSNDPQATETTYGVNAVNRWNIKEVTQAIMASDGLISGGGSLIQDTTSDRSVLYYTGIMFIAQSFGKPVFVYAQGIGPISQAKNKWLTAKAIGQSSIVTVRDIASKEFLETIGVEKEIFVVPDPVIGLDLSFEVGEKTPTIVVSVRNWKEESDYKKKLAKVLDQLKQLGYSIVFMPMHGKNDVETSLEVLTSMNEEATIFNCEASLDEKLKAIASCTLVVGMRLHSLIFAAIVETPFVALSYDPKIDAFAQQANQPLLNDIEGDWTDEQLFVKIKQSLANIEEEKEKIKDFLKKSKEKAQQTAKLAIELFSKKE